MRILCAFFILALCFPSLPSHAESTEIAFSPHQGATHLVIKAIGTSQKTIEVAAYSFTFQPIADALIKAAMRGVTVRLVVDKSQKRQKLVYYAQNNGIKVRICYRFAIMHDKFMVIDQNTLELGSFNYTHAAENNNAENVMVISDAPDIAQKYKQQWQTLWDQSLPPGSTPPPAVHYRRGR